jgi:hypothetical protein
VDDPIDPNATPPHQPPPPFAQQNASPAYPQPYPPAGYGQSPYPPPGGAVPPDPSGAHPAVRGGYATVLPGYPSPPPARGNRKVWIFVGCLLALIVAGVATLLAVGASDDDDGPPAATHQLRVPDSFGSYQRLHSAQAQQVEQDMRDRFATRGNFESQVYAHAQLGIYAVSSQAVPSLYYIGVDGTHSATVRDLLDSNSPSHNADSFLLGASVSTSTSYPEGNLGGSLKCGNGEQGQAMCVWVDHSTLGVVLDVDESVPLQELAQATRALRTAAEY